MEEELDRNNKLYGLIGKNISYSFSKSYFKKKFLNEKLIGNSYVNFDLQKIEEVNSILKKYSNLKGLNVTIPYKEAILPFLDELSDDAFKIGAVNTIKVTKNGLTGYNTDHYGFKKSLLSHINNTHKKALILGTGGASKAIAFVLNELNISYKFVSRKPTKHSLSYQSLTEQIIAEYTLIINCTPLGTFPDIEEKPSIPYQYLTSEHLLYDLIYNPEETSFLKSGKQRGAKICNGLPMLEFQAEKAWSIWNS